MDPLVEGNECQVWRTVLRWELLRQICPSYTQICEQYQKPPLLHTIDGHFRAVLGRSPVRTKSQQTQVWLDREWDDPKSSWYLSWTRVCWMMFGLKGGEKYLFLIKDSQTRSRYLKSTSLRPSLFHLLPHVPIVVIFLPLEVYWSCVFNFRFVLAQGPKMMRNLISLQTNKGWCRALLKCCFLWPD